MLNKGIFLGLFQGVPLWLIVVALIVVIVVAALPAQAGKTRQLSARIGILLVVVGGCGNLWLRYTHGGVLDTLNIYGVIYNNVWDYLIVVGLLIYGYTSIVRR